MEEINVAIVGGGPSGLQAAISLASKGYSPIVFEEHPTIGQPIQCGEGISLNALKEFNLVQKSKLFCVKEYESCKLYLPSNDVILGDIHSYTINRDIFDQYLAKEAQRLGAKIKLSTKIDGVQRKGESIIIKTSSEKNHYYKCEMLVLAEGPQARLASKLGFSPPSPLISAFEYKIEGEWGDALEFYFDNEKYPFGYCWVFPKKGETNVGIVTTAKERKRRLDKFLKEKKITGKIIKKVGGQIPMNGPSSKLYDNRIMLVGDTAGMVNPIFYGGTRLAMLSGKIAGEVVATNLERKANGLSYSYKEYESKLKKYDFMKKVNLKCHNSFYGFSNKSLSKIGDVFNNRYINRIEKLEKLEVFWKILKNPSLSRKIKGLYYMYRGFKIARDWGF
ncbi:MAG: NAD(P)/FAD-dependent oxidoreductase [Candidatus Heimdallarchaeaceae archaeon]|jgi:digeranylgeranylglycerophospholipid reductase